MPRLNYRLMKTCIRGHDLTLEGATEPNGNAATIRCVECRRRRDRDYKQRREQQRLARGRGAEQSDPTCRNGHAMTGGNVGWMKLRTGGERRFCRACKKKGNAKQNSTSQLRRRISDADLTRLVLDLDREREHAPEWEKPIIAARIEQLRAQQHRVQIVARSRGLAGLDASTRVCVSRAMPCGYAEALGTPRAAVRQ